MVKMRFGLQLSPPLSLALHARSQIPADTIPQTSTLRAPTSTFSSSTTTTTTAAAAAAAMVSALILLAEGTEESEYTITYDVLVRGGVSVRSALVPPCDSAYVTCSRGVRIVPDISLPCPAEAVREYDALIIPGGAKGAETISSSSDVHALIKHMHDAGKVVGAICAGSLAIQAAHLAPGAKITSHPSVKSQLESGKTPLPTPLHSPRHKKRLTNECCVRG